MQVRFFAFKLTHFLHKKRAGGYCSTMRERVGIKMATAPFHPLLFHNHVQPITVGSRFARARKSQRLPGRPGSNWRRGIDRCYIIET